MIFRAHRVKGYSLPFQEENRAKGDSILSPGARGAGKTLKHGKMTVWKRWSGFNGLNTWVRLKAFYKKDGFDLYVVLVT
jgi:hypothetical protein